MLFDYFGLQFSVTTGGINNMLPVTTLVEKEMKI